MKGQDIVGKRSSKRIKRL